MLSTRTLQILRRKVAPDAYNVCEVLTRTEVTDADGAIHDTFVASKKTHCRVMFIPRTPGSEVEAGARNASGDYDIVLSTHIDVVERDRIRVYNADSTGYIDYDVMNAQTGMAKRLCTHCRCVKRV